MKAIYNITYVWINQLSYIHIHIRYTYIVHIQMYELKQNILYNVFISDY